MKTTFVVSAMLAGLAMASPAQKAPKAACKVNTDCKPNEHCDNTGACVLNKAIRDAPLAKLHQACHVDGDCDKDLLCVKDICSPAKNKRDAPLAHVNQACKANGDCVKGLMCEKDICIALKDKRDVSQLGRIHGMELSNNSKTLSELGQPCHVAGDCVKGLVCGQDDTCIAPKDKREVRVST